MTEQERVRYKWAKKVFEEAFVTKENNIDILKGAIRIMKDLVPSLEESHLKELLFLIDRKVRQIEFTKENQQNAINRYNDREDKSKSYFRKKALEDYVTRYKANCLKYDELLLLLSKQKEIGSDTEEEKVGHIEEDNGLRRWVADRLVDILTQKVENSDLDTTRIIKSANQKLENLAKETDPKVISTAKNLVFSNNQSSTVQTDGINNKIKNYNNLARGVKFIVEEVMGLTPREYDAIYSNKLNYQAHIDYAIRKIVDGADISVNKKTLFVSKQTLFAIVWPEYYNKNYGNPQPWQIFNAEGEIKSGFIRAGKPRSDKDQEEGVGREQLQNGNFSTKKKKKTATNHGDEVDKLLYWAMTNMLAPVEITTKQLFRSLANPKKYGWNKHGFVQIIQARKCYPSVLDFYFLNSPKAFQEDHLYEYYDAREEEGLPKEPALEILMRAYEYAQYGYQGGKNRNREEEPDLDR